MGDAGLPAGSQLVYSATWQQGVLLQDYTSVVSDISPSLAAQGIIIDSATGVPWYKSGYGVTLNVHTTSDRNSPNDVKSIIDGLIYAKESGAMPQSSITTAQLAQQIPSTPAGTPIGSNPSAIASDAANYQAAISAGDTAGAQFWLKQYQADSGGSPQPFDLASWLSSNWLWVAVIGGGAIVLREVM